jgi:serine/threonine protein kinase
VANGVSEAAVRAAVGNVDEFESLGGGGQGLVWRVRRGNDVDVVKVLHEVDAERAEREVGALQRVNSRHVMQYRGTLTVVDGNRTFAAIRGEFIPGGTVMTRIQRDEWPSEVDALRCVRAVLLALEALHDVDLVHRDIKPENVALRDGHWDEAVVLDLGLVRDLVAASITQYPQLLGTLPYMAPEQLRLERAVKRTDVFAVGVLIYALLTRELPYVSESEDQALNLDQLRRRMLERTDSSDWPRWSRVQQALQPDVATLLSRLLEPDAFSRPRVGEAIRLTDDILAERARP